MADPHPRLPKDERLPSRRLRGANTAGFRMSAAVLAVSLVAGWSARCLAAVPDPCFRPSPGSRVVEPRDLRSRNGVLRLDLTIHNHREAGDIATCSTMALNPRLCGCTPATC